MIYHSLEVATSCGIEQVENINATKMLKRRWQRIKGFLSLFGYNKTTLNLMHRWMYGDWEDFSHKRNIDFLKSIKEGFVGNTVVMNKSVFPKIGLWDERLQAADFDLYVRTKTRHEKFGDVKPVHICLDVFNHHYIRLTAKLNYPRFVDFNNLISLEDKWSESELSSLRNLNS